jgi:hypothetical protein
MGGMRPIMLCYTDEERHSKHGPLAVSHVLQSAAGQEAAAQLPCPGVSGRDPGEGTRTLGRLSPT